MNSRERWFPVLFSSSLSFRNRDRSKSWSNNFPADRNGRSPSATLRPPWRCQRGLPSEHGTLGLPQARRGGEAVPWGCHGCKGKIKMRLHGSNIRIWSYVYQLYKLLLEQTAFQVHSWSSSLRMNKLVQYLIARAHFSTAQCSTCKIKSYRRESSNLKKQFFLRSCQMYLSVLCWSNLSSVVSS